MKLKADLHLHTHYSNRTQKERWPEFIANRLIDSRLEVEDILKECVKKNIKVLSITDHDEIEGSLLAQKMAKKYKLIAITGVEVTSGEGHVLAYDVREKIPTKLGVKKTIDYIHKLGGIAVAAHPFSPQGVFFRKWSRFYNFDAIEVYSGVSGKIVSKAVDYAKKYKLPMMSGSDAKALSIIGTAYIEIDSKMNEKSILKSIVNGKIRPKTIENINRLYMLKEIIKSNYISK